MENIEKLYKLKPLEILEVEHKDEYDIIYATTYYTRVPGGWVYSYDKSSTFIPYSTEFEPKKQQKQKELFTPEKQKSKTLEERKDEFRQKVISICKEKEYNLETIGKPFFYYWSEHGENDKKMKFEKQKEVCIKQKWL